MEKMVKAFLLVFVFALSACSIASMNAHQLEEKSPVGVLFNFSADYSSDR